MEWSTMERVKLFLMLEKLDVGASEVTLVKGIKKEPTMGSQAK